MSVRIFTWQVLLENTVNLSQSNKRLILTGKLSKPSQLRVSAFREKCWTQASRAGGLCLKAYWSFRIFQSLMQVKRAKKEKFAAGFWVRIASIFNAKTSLVFSKAQHSGPNTEICFLRNSITIKLGTY